MDRPGWSGGGLAPAHGAAAGPRCDLAVGKPLPSTLSAGSGAASVRWRQGLSEPWLDGASRGLARRPRGESEKAELGPL